MRRRTLLRSASIAALVVLLLPSAAVRAAGIAVEQIEAFEVDGNDDPKNPTRYAPVDFGGQPTVAGNGDYAGLTFHADSSVGMTNTFSYHAQVVGNLFFGLGESPAHTLISDVYNAQADAFLNDVVNVQDTTGIAAAPGAFVGGAQVINNSYVGDFGSAAADLDAQRRIDFMVAQASVTFVAAAATSITSTNGVPDVDPAVWSSFNALAVSGSQSFDPSRSPGKPHADLSMPNIEASFATATVSGYAAALVGQAAAAAQADGEQGVVVRSLLMAGADKGTYTRQTDNNLDPHYGAGQPDYDASLAILEGGEKPLATVAGGSVAATPSITQQGWASGPVTAGGQSAVLFTSASAVTGVTASLNWDVTQNQPAAGQIDTTDAGVVFPNLTLAVCPATLTNGRYALGPVEATLDSAATGDNVQYLYSTDTLPAGTYALVIDGDPQLSPTVGLSYALRGTFASRYAALASGSWAVVANWSGGIPNGPGAVATIAGNRGVTVTLDGDRRVGQIILGGATGSTVASGTGGTLTIDDAGDSTGTPAPAITTAGGTFAINSPVSLADGVTVTVAGALTLGGPVTGTGGLTKTGSGSLLLTAANAYGDTTVTAGTLTLANTASINGNLAVSGGRATFAAGAAGGGTAPRNVARVSVGSNGVIALAPSAASDDRTVLVASSLSLDGGQLDLGNGDLILHDGSIAAVTAAAAAGCASGTWAGTGLASVAAAADPNHLTALGVIENVADDGTTPVYTAFDGRPATATDVLARYTYYGDTNLDGVVNGADYSRIDAGFVGHLTGWASGDFNYDGVVDGSDYTLMDNAFNQQAGAIAPPTVTALEAGVAVVPEPTATAVLLVTIAATLGKRRRN